MVPIDQALLRALAEGDAAFEAHCSGRLGAAAALARKMVEMTAAAFPSSVRGSRWGGYLSVDEGSGQVAGCCGFKGPPDAAGSVEIAYHTFP